MVRSQTFPLIYLKLLRQCGFRTEHGTEIRESQVSPTCVLTCLYVFRVPPVPIYPQVTRRFWPSTLFLLGKTHLLLVTRKKPLIAQ